MTSFFARAESSIGIAAVGRRLRGTDLLPEMLP